MVDEVCEKIFMKKVFYTHDQRSGLTVRNPQYAEAVRQHLLLPFLEDAGHGDMTTELLGIGTRKVAAQIVAKESGIVAGLEELGFFLGMLRKDRQKLKMRGPVVVSANVRDGEFIRRGAVLVCLMGSVGDILKIERTVLNFLQRMCGVATTMSRYVKAVEPYRVMICPTRKTLFGLLDKKACALGGGGTHRLHLGDAVLVKDTHLDCLDHDFQKIFQKVHPAHHFGRFLELEVESLRDAQSALEILKLLSKKVLVSSGIMFDNMKPRTIKTFLQKLSKTHRRDFFFEASGGITMKNIRAYARTGVDILSIGALTHSVKALDLSLKISK